MIALDPFGLVVQVSGALGVSVDVATAIVVVAYSLTALAVGVVLGAFLMVSSLPKLREMRERKREREA